MRIHVATSNPGKLREFQQATAQIGYLDIEIVPLPLPPGEPAPEENGRTFEANAAIKAAHYSNYTEGFVFADDSGLVVDALQGDPGVRSARYAGENAGDAANNALLLLRMQGKPERTARFVCAIALARAGEVLAGFRGTIEGKLLDAPRGENGFGYDPLFYFPPLNRSTAELTPLEKIHVSHRGQALRKMLDWLRTAMGSPAK